MMDRGGLEEKESQDYEFLINVGSGEFDSKLAYYEVLKDIGFGVLIRKGDSAAHEKRVLVKKDERERINNITEFFKALPENLLFSYISGGAINLIEDVLNDKRPAVFPFDWAEDNKRLVERCLKRACLIAADYNEREGLMEEVWVLRRKGNMIDELPLGPTEMREVIKGKVGEILEEHPELRP